MARDCERMARELRRYLPGGAGITGITPLSTGHSNETYLLEGIDRILRMPPSEEGLLPPYDMARQHAILSAVGCWHAGPPVPRVFELCTDPAVIGDPFFLMQRLVGEAFEYRVPDWLAAAPSAVRTLMCTQWIGALAAVHGMPAALMPAELMTVREEAEHWRDVAAQGEAPQLLFDLLDDLIARPPPASGAPTPVHGDPKHGNCLWNEGRLTALLDWEMSQVAEPMLDLGYVLMFHDQGEASLADAGFELPGWWSAARMIDEWEKGTGRRAVDVARYTVLGQAKVAAIISLGAHLFDSGKTKDQRFAAFGALLPSYTALLIRRAEAAG